jgi:G3E family GTPase
VTTVADARHIGMRLDDSREAAEQIAFADQIVLNKTDLVGEQELVTIESRLRRINPLAPIYRTQRARVDLEKILGRGGFDLARIVSLEPHFLESAGEGEPGHVHDEHCGHDHHDHDDGHGHQHAGRDPAPALGHDHRHDDAIESVSLASGRAMDREPFERWLQAVVTGQGQNILRLKGIIDIHAEPRRLVVQGVHMLLEGELQRYWAENEPRSSRLVFIGRKLDTVELQAGFEACASPAARLPEGGQS